VAATFGNTWRYTPPQASWRDLRVRSALPASSWPLVAVRSTVSFRQLRPASRAKIQRQQLYSLPVRSARNHRHKAGTAAQYFRQVPIARPDRSISVRERIQRWPPCSPSLLRFEDGPGGSWERRLAVGPAPSYVPRGPEAVAPAQLQRCRRTGHGGRGGPRRALPCSPRRWSGSPLRRPCCSL